MTGRTIVTDTGVMGERTTGKVGKGGHAGSMTVRAISIDRCRWHVIEAVS